MAIPEYPSSRHSLIPSFIYSSSLKPLRTANLDLNFTANVDNPSPTPAPPSTGLKLMIPAPSEKKIAMFSPAYYAACTAGGIFSCGLTHMAVTPLDLVKCNMQINPAKYKGIGSGFQIRLADRDLFCSLWWPSIDSINGRRGRSVAGEFLLEREIETFICSREPISCIG